MIKQFAVAQKRKASFVDLLELLFLSNVTSVHWT